MIQEAIAHIETKAAERIKTTPMTVPQEPKDVYFLVGPDGKAERHLAEPAPRQYTASSLTGLCQQINHFGGKPVVFVGKGRITVVLDEPTRRERISMTLTGSQAFAFLNEATATPKSIQQKALVWELRTRFRSQVSPADFLADLRQLRFMSGDEGEATVGVGRESLRRNVQAGVLMGGGKDLAEEITITAPVYDGIPEFGVDQDVRVAVDVNLAEQTLVLRTLPGEVEAAVINTHHHIREFIQGACPDTVVFVDSAC